ALWLALAAAEALWSREAYGEDGLDVALPTPPQVVLDELAALGGRSQIGGLRVSDAVGYLADAALLPILADHVPELDAVLELLDRSLGVGTTEVAELVLRGAGGASLATSAVYLKLRDLLASALERVIDDDLLPRLEAA